MDKVVMINKEIQIIHYYNEDVYKSSILKYNDIKIGDSDSTFETEMYEIKNIFIHERFQGLGYGQMFLQYIITEIQDNYIKLKVCNTFKDAIHIYEKSGFKYVRYECHAATIFNIMIRSPANIIPNIMLKYPPQSTIEWIDEHYEKFAEKGYVYDSD